jgi:kynurenine 3-monooxygenase
MSENRVIIIGAGLAGSLLSIYLAKRGIKVDIFEARGDMRTEKVAAGRSINLALSDRGIAALREVGMDEYMLSEAVPMYGRMIHSPTGETKLLPYSGRKGEYINSVSRAGLNSALINEAEKYPEVQFVFNEDCVELDLPSGEAVFASGRTRRANTIFAADGAGSAVRRAIEKQLSGFESTSIFLDHGYKELHIPSPHNLHEQPDRSAFLRENHLRERVHSSAFAIEPNALHIWPRHQFMMIALPNFDGSFTCTLFLDKEEMAALSTPKKVIDFFQREFPDAIPLMPTLTEDFFENPTGELGTLKCWPWNVEGKVLLLGDSAHAMVPFYGQGMNCAFEDVRVLDSLLSEQTVSGGGQLNWRSIFEAYAELRKANTDAIQDMAEENFYEMRDATADPVFQRKRELETRLEQTYPDYFSKYSMVTFREDLPYRVAKEKGNEQDRLLMERCAAIGSVNDIDLDALLSEIRSLD